MRYIGHLNSRSTTGALILTRADEILRLGVKASMFPTGFMTRSIAVMNNLPRAKQVIHFSLLPQLFVP